MADDEATEPDERPDERPIDQRGKLADEPFDLQVTRDKSGRSADGPGGVKILVRFRNRLVRTLVGTDAEEVRAAIAAGDPHAVQLLVARKTGNFKRGNER